MNSKSGFTLIEALVAGTLSVLIPGVIITLLRVNNEEVAYNSTRSRLTQIANVVSDDIRATAFQASMVFSPAVASPPNCPGGPSLLGDVQAYQQDTAVVFCDTNGAVLKSYRVRKLSHEIGQLEERFRDGMWLPFTVGTDIVKVDLNTDAYEPKSGGIFGIGLKAHFIFFNFHYHMEVGGVSSTLSMQTESVVCRNSTNRVWGP